MSMPPEICDISEIIAELQIGSTITDPIRALLQQKKQQVENEIRATCEWNITQQTYTHYLPNKRGNMEDWDTDAEVLNYNGSTVSWGRPPRQYGDVLQLPQMYVRSITSIYEDYNAKGGQGSGDFPSTTLLVAGTDYFLDVDESGLSIAGQVIRIGPSWSYIPRTIKVTYVAGLTAAELDTTFSDIKAVAIEETIGRFKWAMSRSGADSTGVGPVSSEKLGGEYAVSYAFNQYAIKSVSMGQLSDNAQMKLERYMRMDL